MWELLQDVFLDAFLDSLKMLPFLFIAYLILEYIEHRSSTKLERFLGSNRLGAVGGALLGCVPQCGFSVTAANLYAGRVITVGTLVAVFLSTSDEALPLMLAHPEAYPMMFALLGIKVGIAVIAGFAVDFAACWIRKDDYKGTEQEKIHAMCKTCHCEHGIWGSALRHTVSIFLFIYVVLFILNLCVELVGEEQLASFLLTGSVFQPLVAGLIGFIPNCAASVLLTELYLAGSISFGSAVAGLCTSAGVGLAVLYKVNRNFKDNLIITMTLYVVGIVAGMIIQLF